MRSSNCYYWNALLGFTVFLFGCSSADEPAAELEAPSSAPTMASAPEPTSKAPLRDADAAKAPTTATAQFSPPFPDRTELFEPPKRAENTIRQNDNEGETVELKGFINVDQPRVVLSIDGVVAPIAEGGEKYGVQVISIQPPSVVLQRGRSRWTATLE